MQSNRVKQPIKRLKTDAEFAASYSNYNALWEKRYANRWIIRGGKYYPAPKATLSPRTSPPLSEDSSDSALGSNSTEQP